MSAPLRTSRRHSTGDGLGQSGSALPLLSRTLRSSQLQNPRCLERITIDDRHYHGYLVKSTEQELPHLTAIKRRVARMGDNLFFVHKDIPVHQQYARTSLHLSDVRPWDEIVPRPLTSAGDQVLRKEVSLPFPAEHPYTSHMSRFAVFPDTRDNTRPPLPTVTSDCVTASSSCRPNTSDAQTQTPPSLLLPHLPGPTPNNPTPHGPTSYFVLHKASEDGRRVECRVVDREVPVEASRTGNTIWDVPRTQRHKRAYTYPAPHLRFAPPSSASRSSALSPQTHTALNTIHKLLTRTTTYSENFSGHSSGPQNYLCLDSPVYRNVASYRPHTAESRGKYNKATYFCSTVPNSTMLARDATADREGLNSPNEEELEGFGFQQGVAEGDVNDHSALSRIDRGTQTEIEDSLLVNLPSIQHPPQASIVSPDTMYRLPQIPRAGQSGSVFHERSSSARHPSTHDQHLALPQGYHRGRPKSASALQAPNHTHFHSGDSTAPHPHHRSLSTGSYLPQSAITTRRMGNLFNGFSKSDVLRRFHQQYPEKTPDLRDNSIREGKRHIIHGYHAYYFH